MQRAVMGLVMVLELLAWPGGPAMAEDAKPQKETGAETAVITNDDWAKVQTMAKWFDRFTFSGDVRFRHETLFNNYNDNGAFNYGVDQHRERFRLRVGVDVRLGDFMTGIRLASGVGQQVSTNQTETTLSSEKDFWIDRVYLSWQGSSTRWLKITIGRMANPFYVPYSSDVMWDDDYNPEGYAENLRFSLGDHANLFLNAGQIVLNEQAKAGLATDTSVIPPVILGINGNTHAPWLFGEQVGVTVEPTPEWSATLATAFYGFVNVNDAPLGGTVQQGNSRTGPGLVPQGTLVNNYRVLDVAAVLQTRAGSIPVTFMGDYIRNLANTTLTGLSTGTATGNYGYQVGVIVGKAAEAHTWELAYFYKLLLTDATVADIVDSDFGNGGTSRRGHIMWAAYNPTKFIQLKVKYFSTTSIIPTNLSTAPVPSGCFAVTPPFLPSDYPQQGSCGAMNRLQADISMKF
jgi:hypothetical protein